MSELTVELIREYSQHLNKPRPNFPDKSHLLLETEPSKLGKLSIFDTETTDIKLKDIEVTEIFIQEYLYNTDTLEIISEGRSYHSFNEPNDLSKITPEITVLTGITAEKVKGHKIDWNQVNAIFSEMNFIIAHNVRFDKERVLTYLPELKATWLCSCHGVDWTSKGAPNKKQEILVLGFGHFTYPAHRADEDVKSLGILLEKTNVLGEMVANANKKTMRVEGFLDAYQQSTIKDIVTKQGIQGFKFKQNADEIKADNGEVKKVWYYECKNLTVEQFEEVKNELKALVIQHNPKGVDKIKLFMQDQSY